MLLEAALWQVRLGVLLEAALLQVQLGAPVEAVLVQLKAQLLLQLLQMIETKPNSRIANALGLGLGVKLPYSGEARDARSCQL